MNGNRPNELPPRDNISYWIASGRPTWDPTTQQIHINGVTVGTYTSTTYNGPDYFSATLLGGNHSQMFIDQNGLSYWSAPQAFNNTSALLAGTTVNGPTAGGQADRFLQTTGIAGATGTAAKPSAQPLFVTTPTISDKSIYDWSSINLAAPNRLMDRTLTTNVPARTGVPQHQPRSCWRARWRSCGKIRSAISAICSASPTTTASRASWRSIPTRSCSTARPTRISCVRSSPRTNPGQCGLRKNGTPTAPNSPTNSISPRKRTSSNGWGCSNSQRLRRIQIPDQPAYSYRDTMLDHKTWLQPGVISQLPSPRPRGRRQIKSSPTACYRYYVGDNQRQQRRLRSAGIQQQRRLQLRLGPRRSGRVARALEQRAHADGALRGRQKRRATSIPSRFSRRSEPCCKAISSTTPSS